MPPKIGPLHEIILYVSNMIAQVSFYRDTLGLEVAYPEDLGDGSEAFWVVFNTGQCSLALHGGGEKRIGDDAPKIVFRVDEIESVREYLTSQGVPMSEIFYGILPFWLAMMVCAALLILFPDLALFLPTTMKGG